MTAPFAAGDRVLLVDNKQAPAPHHARGRRRSSTPTPASSTTTTSSASADGTTVRTSRGARLVAVRPTLAEYVLEMPRGAQVIYPKDLGPILVLADIFPGARILESGVGSGALTTALLRAIGPTGHVTGYEIRDDFARARAIANVHGFLGDDVPLDVEVRDVYEGIDERDLDRDRARPARAVARREARGRGAAAGRHPARVPADDPPGRPAARGAARTRRSAWSRRSRCCSARWHVEGQSIRPDHRMVAHTGFLTHARLLARDT